MTSVEATFVSADKETGASVDAEGTEKHLEIFPTLKASFLKPFKVMDRELKIHPYIDCFL